MELFDEDFNTNKKQGNKKTTTIILAIIIFLAVMVVVLLGLIAYLKESTLQVNLNNVESAQVRDILFIDEANPSKVYVPIKQIASYLGYNAYNGSYTTKSEENNQCYIESENEVAMFSLNSNVLYKTMPDASSDYEYFYLDEPVIAKNNELYTTIDGIEKAFNVTWDYDVENKSMHIYTMPYLINFYAGYVLNYGYDKISEDYTNQKAILDDMLVVEKGTESSGTKVAVITASTGNAILEPKYENIQYLQHTSDFLVSDGGKVGIISKAKKTKVAIQYTNIELMDYDAELYAVEHEGKFGVIDFKGNIVINLDYDKIGIDNSNFKENDIKSGYILADNLIPVKKDDLWGFFDTTGKQITECKYDNLGYVTSNNSVGYSLLLVPDYDVIVVEKDKRYNLMTSTGEEIWDFFPFDSVYLSIAGGETSYKMTYDSNTLDVCDYLDRLGYGKNSNTQHNTTEENNNQTNEQ